MQVRLRPLAERDIDAHAAYLSEQGGLELGLRFYDALEATLQHVVDTPGIGRLRVFHDPSLAEVRSFRVNLFEKVIVFYRVDAKGIEVVRVLHGARDLEIVLGGDR